MSIPADVATALLVKCGRHCCLCKKFEPIRLQVHHIVPGGSDEPENLIALCLTCHSYVHTKAPFTRRFSADELKQHRDDVCRLVGEGKLPNGEGDTEQLVAPFSTEAHQAIGRFSTTAHDLSETARELLVKAVESESSIAFLENIVGGPVLMVGREKLVSGGRDLRVIARYRDALRQLRQMDLIDDGRSRDGVYSITHEGYLLADEILAAASQAHRD